MRDDSARSAPAALLPSLELAVTMHMFEIRGRPVEWMRAEASRCAGIVGSQGDNILYRSARTGATAAAFNALALGLAILAYAPGGVTFAGAHWQAPGGPLHDLDDAVRSGIVDLDNRR